MGHAQIFSSGSLKLDGSNIINYDGTDFEAINFYSGDDTSYLTAGHSVTINGITFTGVTGGSNLSGPDFSLTDVGIDSGRAGGVTSSNTVYPLVLDGTYNNNGSANQTQTLTLENLTSGVEYSAQLFFDASDTGAGRSASVTDGTQTSSVVTAGTAFGPQYITDTFTAGSSGIESLLINDATSYGGKSPLELSGFVVEEVPEPSTWALLVVSLTASLAWFARLRRLNS